MNLVFRFLLACTTSWTAGDHAFDDWVLGTSLRFLHRRVGTGVSVLFLGFRRRLLSLFSATWLLTIFPIARLVNDDRDFLAFTGSTVCLFNLMNLLWLRLALFLFLNKLFEVVRALLSLIYMS